MSCTANSYKKEDYQARPVRPIHTRKKNTKLCRCQCPVRPIHTRKKTTKLGRFPMSCTADSYKKEDNQVRPLSNVLCGRFIQERRLPSVTGEIMLNTFCPGLGSNQDLLLGSRHYTASLQKPAYTARQYKCVFYLTLPHMFPLHFRFVPESQFDIPRNYF